MYSFFNSRALTLGLAMFAMFFGAGNIIYPLALGQYAGDKNFFAMAGMILTAVIVPISGVVAMILFDGNYSRFFGRMGRVPGFLLALTIISLIGPLGSAPRCIALSYAALKGTFPGLSSLFFCAVACVLIYLCTFRRGKMLDLLGGVLTPFLLVALTVIVVVGLIDAPAPQNLEVHPADIFLHGLNEGYKTMDLLAAFFFSSTILALLNEGDENKTHSKTLLQASGIAVCLLAVCCVGFSYIASYHGTGFEGGEEELLVAITMKLLGPYAGIIVSVAVALACLTTAIALVSAFSDFAQREVFGGKAPYEWILVGTLLVTFFVSTFEFTAIASFLTPILKVSYPALIALTFLNILHRLTGFKMVKTPIAVVFACSLLFQLVF